MKPVFTTFLFLLSFILCFSQQVVFTTQAEVDAFDSNITTINGDLLIGNDTPNSSITDLSNLSNLTTIQGGLSIENNTVLTDLSGLDNITNIQGGLGIYDNTMLSSIESLGNLTTSQPVFILGNTSLSSLNGLQGLTNISSISLGNNNLITNLSGLDNITSIVGNVQIWNNGALVNLSGLDQLTSIGGTLNIHDNPILSSLEGLDNLASVGAVIPVDNFLIIQDNPNLSDCCSIKELLSTPGAVDGVISIYNNVSPCDHPTEIVNDDCTVSIFDNEEAPTIKVYPNPSDNDVYFDLKNIEGTIDIIIYDSMGKASFRSLQISDASFILEQDALPHGIYFYQIQQDSRVISSGKFLLQ